MRKPSLAAQFALVEQSEVAWAAMCAAREGKPSMLGTLYECGSADLFNRQGACVQRSMTGYVADCRYLVLWWPLEPAKAPQVYRDTSLSDVTIVSGQ